MFLLEYKKGQILFLFLVFVLAVVVRLPLILNANVLFNSDHAVNALTIKHLFENGEFQVYYYGIRYQGLLEPLLIAPILIAGEYMPLSWFVGATVIHLLFILVFWICSKEFCENKWAPFWVVLFLALSPFAYTYWSTDSVLAGHGAVCIWFILIIYVAKRKWSVFSLGNDVILAMLIVLGLYHYRLFQVYLPSVFFLLFFRTFQHRKSEDGRWLFKPFYHLAGVFFLVALGLLLISKCADLTDYSCVYPAYSGPGMLESLFSPAKFLANIPLFKVLLLYVSGNTHLLVTTVVMALSLTSFIFCRGNRMIQLLLASAVFFTFLTFYVVPDTYVDRTNVRYILHVYPIIILTMVNALYGISSRWKYLRWPAYGFLLFLLCANGYNNYREYAPNGCSWEYRSVSASPYYRLGQFLKKQGFTYCKADYWTAYATTYFSDEQVVVTSDATVRYPPYDDQVKKSEEIGYIKRAKIPGLMVAPLEFEGFFVYPAVNHMISEKEGVSVAELERPERFLLSGFFRAWDKTVVGEDFQRALSAMRIAQCEGLDKVISQSYEMVRGFMASELDVNKSDAAAVKQFYEGVLGRKALESETSYWVELIKCGKHTREEVLVIFFNSAEFRERAKYVVAAGCYG